MTTFDLLEVVRIVLPNVMGLLLITALMGSALLAVRLGDDERPEHRHFVLLASLVGVAAVLVMSLGLRVLLQQTVWIGDALMSDTVLWALALAWGAGLAALFVRLALGRLSLRRVVRDARCFGPSEAHARIADECAFRVGLERSPRVIFAPRAASPMVVGVHHPRIVLPESLRDADECDLRAVLLHELAHVRRGDCLAEWLVQVIGGLMWWHPVYWLVATRLRELREMACDDMAAFGAYPRERYAELLVRFAMPSALPFCPAFAAVRMADRRGLHRRIDHIFAEHRGPTTWRSIGFLPTAISNAATLRVVLAAVFVMVVFDATMIALAEDVAEVGVVFVDNLSP